MDTFDLTKYPDMALRRKYWIIIPLLVSILGGLGFYLTAPRVYEAETLIMVQPQRVPDEFVRSIVSTPVEDRVKTITQQVTSRTNLENIIREYPSLKSSSGFLTTDRLVVALRKAISIKVSAWSRATRGPSTFTIAFRGKDPETITKVTNTLASNFISENLRIRESQAIGTSKFLSDELESVKSRLEQKEEELKKYRETYMGGLPEQLQTNLSISNRLQAQLDQFNDNLSAAENRKIMLEQQLAETEKASSSASFAPGQSDQAMDLESLRNQLAYLETKYTENHPDIIRLKAQISSLEKDESDSSTSPTRSSNGMRSSRVTRSLSDQMRDTELTINRLKAEIKEIELEIKVYQKRIEETPKREQEMLSLKRDYANLRDLHNSLLNRKLEAEISVNMEKKQKGEQFLIIDPAKTPTYPVDPDIKKIMLLTLALGLCLGAGLAYLNEFMDTSYKTPEDVEKELQVPVLAAIPFYYTPKERRNHKVKEVLKAASVGIGFGFSAVGIVLATKGFDSTLNFAKHFLSKFGVL